MKLLKRYTLIGILFVSATGAISHFLYEWSGANPIVGLFTPVSESIWEHMKLLFFPMLLYSVIMICKFKRRYPCVTSALFFGILAGTLLIPLFYYVYTFVLGKHYFALDIATFILSIVISFFLSYRLTLKRRLEPYSLILGILVGILLGCFFLFTYRTPNAVIFQNPAPHKTQTQKATPE